MGHWIRLIDRGGWDKSNSYFWSMPPWVRDRYFKTHPDSGMRKTKGGFVGGTGGGMSQARYNEYGRFMKG